MGRKPVSDSWDLELRVCKSVICMYVCTCSRWEFVFKSRGMSSPFYCLLRGALFLALSLHTWDRQTWQTRIPYGMRKPGLLVVMPSCIHTNDIITKYSIYTQSSWWHMRCAELGDHFVQVQNICMRLPYHMQIYILMLKGQYCHDQEGMETEC